MSYRGRTCALEWVTEESLKGYALKDTQVAQKSLEGYTLKDTLVNVLQRKDTPVNVLQGKVDLSPARSQEGNIVSPRFFRCRKEILLASCTNCFSSLRGSRGNVFGTFRRFTR